MYEKPEGKKRMLREAAAKWVTLPPEEWVSAAEFKTHCLRLIEEVRQGRHEVVVTRYGKPVAKLVPYTEAPMSIIGHLSGSVVSYGDIVSPVGEPWDADS